MRFYERLEEFGNRTALLDETGGAVSYSDLCQAADRFADEMGAPGLIFLEARNRVDSIAAYLGCLRGGHTVYLFGPQDRNAIDELVARYQPHVLAHCGETGLDIVRRPNVPDIALAPDLRLLMSTSGSTGSSKFVKLSGKNLDSNAKSIVEYLDLDSKSRAITALKPNYSYGLSIINSHLAAGGSLALTELSVVDAGFWEAFVGAGADSLAGVPYTYEMLDRQGVLLSQIKGLRYATQAGGRLPASVVQKFAQDAQASGRRFYVMYGQTEASPRISFLPPDMAIEFPDCIGVPVPGGTIDLIDEEGGVIDGAGQAGELAYRGPNVMMGYAQQRSDLARDETPDVLLTGDIAVRNEVGLFKIVGRSARFIKPFGMRVNLDEVEQWINATMSRSACVGNDDMIVVVFPHDSPCAAEATSVARIAAHFKLPNSAVVIKKIDQIPALENGKTNYKALEQQFLAFPATTVLPPPGVLRMIFSREFADRVLREALVILGLDTKKWSSIADIFKVFLGLEKVDDTDTFSDLAGDSLTYVQVALGIEEYLGHLPDGWEYMSVADLEEADATAPL